MTRIVLTYEDYVALPDDGKRYELHEGELVVTPSPGRRHQRVLGHLYRILVEHVETSGHGELLLSPFDVILTNISVVVPDLSYVDDERLALVRERGVEGSPTLAIEIISPYTGQIDRRRKFALYSAHDVTWYWIVDPIAETIDVHHLEAGAYTLTARLEGREPRALPPFLDLTLDPAAVWR
jgi:Uma2 family endonuclease